MNAVLLVTDRVEGAVLDLDAATFAWVLPSVVKGIPVPDSTKVGDEMIVVLRVKVQAVTP